MKTLREIGEDALIQRIISLVPHHPNISAGPGDDCAVIDPDASSPILQLLKTDAIVSNIHYLSTAAGRAVGWKAAARVISDFAAMGGSPDYFLVTLALPPETAVEWVEDLYRGIGDCLKTYGGFLAGGETSSVPSNSAAVISIAATGNVLRENLVLRSTAKPGHAVMVTGTLGGSIHGKHLDFKPRIAQSQWLVNHYKPTAMMDLSDGIAQDLPRLAEASNCGYIIDNDALPLTPGCTVEQALGDGEDFELMFTIEIEKVPELLSDWPFSEIPLTQIGHMVHVADGDKLTGGWQHFGQ